MHTRHSIAVASVFAVALTAGVVLAASAQATLPGSNGLVAFSARVAGHDQIFVMNPDGSGRRQITHAAANCGFPNISPDGRTIVFVQSASSNTSEIRTITTTGTDPRHLATGGWFPSYSPDGRLVVFVTTYPARVWVMNADGSHQRHIATLAGYTVPLFPAYSPNGKTIAFLAEVFVGAPPRKNRCEILAMNADGSRWRRLAYTTAANLTSSDPTCGFSFSPDGKKIVYSVFAGKTKLLRVMNSDGTGQLLLPRSYGFTWPCYSPDGRRILCVNGPKQICVGRANGTLWRRLTSIPGGVLAPNWGPHAH